MVWGKKPSGLAAAAAGCRKPYANELMQAWFQGFALLLTESSGLNEHEAKKYLASLLVSLSGYMSSPELSGMVALVRTIGSLDPDLLHFGIQFAVAKNARLRYCHESTK